MTDEKWKAAEEHVKELRKDYAELVGKPGVNVIFALSRIDVLLKHYYGGERTEVLYKAMSEAE